MIRVGLLGHGTVGSGVAKILLEKKDWLRDQTGEEVSLVKILDLRDFDVPYADLFTKDAQEMLSDPSIQVIVECMGGIGAAYRFVKEALENGKHVVTSNKELVVEKGTELNRIALEKDVNFFYEASAGGGIPCIRPMVQDLAGNKITKINGILNGTTNYILTRMNDAGVSFDTALKEAQAKGYAEADPSADVLGWDARRKITILAHISFGAELDDSNVTSEGITKLTKEDMFYAREMNRTIKLIASASYHEEDNTWVGSVQPDMLPANHPLAGVNDVFNAVYVHGDMVDDVMFYGRGAGSLPTASAVVGDVVAILKQHGKRVYMRKSENPPACVSGREETARFFARVLSTENCSVQEAEKEALSSFPDARIVRLDNPAYASEFGLVTTLDKQSVLMDKFAALSEKVNLGAVIRFS
ncbi:MAG: homoserine dehydrogenase [Clostridia bacterium]|nr:homoserine dehydrogenase [Clostridia bacterium]